MSSEKNEIPPSSTDDTFKRDHQGKAGKRTFPGFGNRDKVYDVAQVALGKTDQMKESPASQPLRRGPGRPRKQRSDVKEAPEASPPPSSPLGSTGDSPLPVSATTSIPEAVAQTLLGSTSDRPLGVPTDEEETKLNLKPTRILMHPPKTNHSPQILDEESEKVIVKVESLLVKKLLTSGNDSDYMDHQANTSFRYLKWLGVDYDSFYRDVREHIKHYCDFQDAEREESMLSLSALQKNYENAILIANDVGEDLGPTQGERKMAKEKKETLKKQI